MARTVKTSGTNWTLNFCLGVEDDNTTVKAFYAQDSTPADNTTDIQAGLVKNASVSVTTMSWNGHTVPYFAPTANQQGISFGNSSHGKPRVSSFGNPFTLIWLFGNAPAGISSANYWAGPSTSFTCRYGGTGDNRTRIMAASGGTELGLSAHSVVSTDSGLVAFYVNPNASNVNRAYWGAVGGSVTNDNTIDGQGANFGSGDMATVGYDVSNNAWIPIRFILLAAVADTYGTDATASNNRISGLLQPLLDDPMGTTLFEGAGGAFSGEDDPLWIAPIQP